MARPKGSKNKKVIKVITRQATKEDKEQIKKDRKSLEEGKAHYVKDNNVKIVDATLESNEKPVVSNVLTCQNPWKRGEHNVEKGETPTDIWVFICIKGENIPICKSCWSKLADSDHEWGDSKPDLSKREVEMEVE